MQVFIPYSSPIDVAECLDRKRLNKQIIEAGQIIDAIFGYGKGWFNHPVVKMYKNDVGWLRNYYHCLLYYQKFLSTNKKNENYYALALEYNFRAMNCRPKFITEELCIAHRRRLYTKNKQHYKQFANLGESEVNIYYVDGEYVKYVNGKRI